MLAAPVVGRLVDVFDRRNILVVVICLRSLFTALCGRADTNCSSLASVSVRVKHVSGYADPISRTDRCVESYVNLSVVRFVTRGERTSAADRHCFNFKAWNDRFTEIVLAHLTDLQQITNQHEETSQ